MKRKLPDGWLDYLRKVGRKGGKVRARNMTPEERSESARIAGEASGKARKKDQ